MDHSLLQGHEGLPQIRLFPGTCLTCGTLVLVRFGCVLTFTFLTPLDVDSVCDWWPDDGGVSGTGRSVDGRAQKEVVDEITGRAGLIPRPFVFFFLCQPTHPPISPPPCLGILFTQC